MLSLRAMLLSLALALLFGHGGSAEERLALVIGNGDYRTSPLANPRNDADLTAAALADAGFQVTKIIDADQIKMKQNIRAFAVRLRNAGPDAVAAFYYAGHGVQVEGRNYLIPVDATIEAKPDLEYETVEAQWVLDTIGDSGVPLSIIILDACRDNPFRSFTRSGRKGLARMDAPRGTLLSYSTAPGDVAADGVGRNSPFTDALAAAIRTPGIKIEETFKQVRRNVLAKTNDRQLPWEATSLTGDFFFLPPTAIPPAAPQPTAVAPAAAAPVAAAPTAPTAVRVAPTTTENEVIAAEPAPAPSPVFVPGEISMSDYIGSVELRCYHPETRRVDSRAPHESARCPPGYYRISESDYFKAAN
ncbi:MAG: caspase family protein [Pseudomonadota bacterium]